MKNQSFVLVVLDASSRHVRRLSVSRRSIERWLAAGVAVALLLCGLLAHALLRLSMAREARSLAYENRMLGRALVPLEGRLPALRASTQVTEHQAAALGAKSGLGLDMQLLAPVGAAPAAPHAPEQEAPEVADALLLRALHLGNAQAVLQRSMGDILEYFQDAQLMLSNTPSVRPTRTPWLSSSFGKRRDPIFHHWVMHKGLDMAGHIGMRVSAPADGVVIWTGRRGGYGITVVLDHGYQMQTHFAHLNKTLVRVGDRVRRGDPIAEMGSTGKSTGPHLHYEVRRSGQPQDPRRFILD